MQVDTLPTSVPGTGPKSGVFLHLAEAPEEGGRKGNFFFPHISVCYLSSVIVPDPPITKRSHLQYKTPQMIGFVSSLQFEESHNGPSPKRTHRAKRVQYEGKLFLRAPSLNITNTTANSNVHPDNPTTTVPILINAMPCHRGSLNPPARSNMQHPQKTRLASSYHEL